MSRFLFSLILLVITVSGKTLAQAGTEASSEMPYAGAPCTGDGGIKASTRQVATFNGFDIALRSALRKNDATALAFLIHYPLRINTDKGSLLIPDAQSLAGHYSEVFPSRVRDQILATTAEDYICRYDEGLGYKAGSIWVSTDGHKFGLDVVNVESPRAKTSNVQMVYTCETKTHRIVIDTAANGEARYRSWNKPKPVTGAADVELAHGQVSYEGTGVCSVPIYKFSTKNIVYEVQGAIGCTDGSEPKKATGNLTVTIDGKQVTDMWCF